MRLMGLIAVLGCLSIVGCSSNNATLATPYDEEQYVALKYPISLHPAITSGLVLNSQVADNDPAYDRDLLGLSSSITRRYTRQITLPGESKASWYSFGGERKAYQTTFDTIQYVSYPLEVEVPTVLDDACRQGVADACKKRKIDILPLVGAGVRVTVDYISREGEGALSLSGFSDALEDSDIKGSLQLQLVGINRQGPNAAGFTQLNLTPDSVSLIQQQIGIMMSQMWYKDTMIQPKVVGYIVVGEKEIDPQIKPFITEELIANIHKLSGNFFDTLVEESVQLGEIKPTEVAAIRAGFQQELYTMFRDDERSVIVQLVSHMLADYDYQRTYADDIRERAMELVLDEVGDSLDGLDFTKISATVQKASNTAKAELDSRYR